MGCPRPVFHAFVASVILACFSAILPPNVALADVVAWEYIDPHNPDLGKQPSTTVLVPGKDPVPGVNLWARHLNRAWLSRFDLTGAILIRASIGDAALTGSTLDGADLTGVHGVGADLSKASFVGAQMRGASLGGADLSNADFTNADLGALNITQSGAVGAIFDHTNLAGATLSGVDCTHASFVGSRLERVHFVDTVLVNTDLTNADFHGADFSRSNLTGALITGANFAGTANADFGISNILITASGQARTLHAVNLSHFNLAGVDLSDFDLTDAVLHRCTLSSANLSGARITGAELDDDALTTAQITSTASFAARDLSGVIIPRASAVSFDSADLSRFDLAGATIIASFANADLSGADLTNARLGLITGANLTGATIVGARLGGVSFAQVQATSSFQQGTLAGFVFPNDVSGWNLANLDLTGAILASANVTDADLTGSIVLGARLRRLTRSQLESTASWQQKDLRAVNLNGANCAGFDLSGQDLTGAQMRNAVLAGANLAGADLSGADLQGANLTSADLSDADLTGAALTFARVAEADFTGTIIKDAYFGRVRGFTFAQLHSAASYESDDLGDITLNRQDFSRQDLRGMTLVDADLDDSLLTNASLRNTNLTNGVLSGADITGADLTGAKIDGASLVDTGVTFAQFRSTETARHRDLSGIGLARLDLTGWDLSDKYLARATFNSTDLTNATFAHSDLTGPQRTTFAANGKGTDFEGARLQGLRFVGPEGGLRGAVLTDADLRDAGATFTLLANATDTSGTIYPNGTVPSGIVIEPGQSYRLWDFNLRPWYVLEYQRHSITVQGAFSIAPGGMLRVVFDDPRWNGTIRFRLPAPSVVHLDGALSLEFNPDTVSDPGALAGRTFDLFDWHGVTIDGRFADIVTPPGTVWDLSRLYTTGKVTLVAKPASPCVADINADGDVNTFDFAILAANFGHTDVIPYTRGDLDGNGTVDMSDYLVLLTSFGCVQK